MPWFNVDDGFYDHPKVNSASNAAIGLWVKAGSWCAKQLTDGLIPAAQVKRLGGTPAQVKSLLESGLWTAHLHADGKIEKYEIAGYLGANRSRSRVETERKENKERQQKYRANMQSNSDNTNLSQGDKGVSNSAQSKPIQANPGGGRKQKETPSVSEPRSTIEPPPQGNPLERYDADIPEEWILAPHPLGYQRCLGRHPNGNSKDDPCRSCRDTEKLIEGIRAGRRGKSAAMERDRKASRAQGKEVCTVCDHSGYRLGLNPNTGRSKNLKCDHLESDRLDQEAARESDRRHSRGFDPKERHLYVA